ncbi:MAG: lactonase family protein [Treponema sp.]|nr:lactonase family protein [Treponema sp.]
MNTNGFIGTYTKDSGGRAEGIYSFVLNSRTGRIENLRIAARTINPSYLALSPAKQFLYAVNEVNEYEGSPTGSVSTFAVDAATGNLRFINQQSSEGQSPCHIALGSGYAVIANYGDGILAALPLTDGRALGKAVQVIRLSGSGPNLARQEAPHAHSFWFHPRGGWGVACDLGTDRLLAYAIHPKAAPGCTSAEPLTSVTPPWFSVKPGAGPRHGVFHPSGKYAYFVNELDSTVDAFAYAGNSFSRLQTLPLLPPGVAVPNAAAAVKLSLDGQFLYASNRGHDSIAVFRVSQAGGTLAFADCVPSGGKSPRDFAIDPSGAFLLACHQDSDTLTVFHIDQKTGTLRMDSDYAVPSPVCVVF